MGLKLGVLCRLLKVKLKHYLQCCSKVLSHPSFLLYFARKIGNTCGDLLKRANMHGNTVYEGYSVLASWYCMVDQNMTVVFNFSSVFIRSSTLAEIQRQTVTEPPPCSIPDDSLHQTCCD